MLRYRASHYAVKSQLRDGKWHLRIISRLTDDSGDYFSAEAPNGRGLPGGGVARVP